MTEDERIEAFVEAFVTEPAPTSFEIVLAWLEEVKASAPAPWQKAYELHLAEQLPRLQELLA